MAKDQGTYIHGLQLREEENKPQQQENLFRNIWAGLHGWFLAEGLAYLGQLEPLPWVHKPPPGKPNSEDALRSIGADCGQESRVQEEGYIKGRLQGVVGTVGEAKCQLFICSS